MNERAKITASHLAHQAIVYLRQSSPAQVENNRGSTQRQYALANRARELGWSDEQIVVIDEDLGLSGAGSVARAGFAPHHEVALGRVGIVLGLEVSRLARNNADWHRLIELASPKRKCYLRGQPARELSCRQPSQMWPLMVQPQP
jgi:DNA invertase Pin-like site-specific DNA recombinase